MKKLTAVILAAAILSSLTACGSDNAESGETAGDTPVLSEKALEGGDDIPLEMEMEQRLNAAYEALDAAYASGDEAAIAGAEAAVDEMQQAYENAMAEMDAAPEETMAAAVTTETTASEEDDFNRQAKAELDAAEQALAAAHESGDENAISEAQQAYEQLERYYMEMGYVDPETDDTSANGEEYWDIEEEDWDNGHGILVDPEDNPLYGIRWICTDGETEYEIKMYDYNAMTYRVRDLESGESEGYLFMLGEGYQEIDESTSRVVTEAYPTQDLETGAPYAEEIWQFVLVGDSMEMQRYAIDNNDPGTLLATLVFTEK